MDGNQNQPQQPQQPVQAEAGSLEEQMVAEMENSRLIEEQQAAVAAANAAAESNKHKGNSGMLIGMIVAIVLAIGGIGFGVLMMVMRSNDAADYEGRIATLTKTNTALTDQLAAATDEANALDEVKALKVLQEQQAAISADYAVEYARVDECYVNGGATACLVSYVTRSLIDGSLTTQQVSLIEDGNGAWGLEVSEPQVEEIPGEVPEEEMVTE